ncbi:MAG: hypothetical protein ACD_79C01434G0015 [uncultured bacterium]|nr:MAG: hypothetical protein ACD_79C01434G0015 [uncultured bacterium]
MYSEDDLLPISGLQHLIFCPRQCALIHIEQAWEENRFTAEGRVMHEKVHDEGHESRGKIRTVYSLMLRSMEYGLIGKADVVEFHFENQIWHPFPVEYKRGNPKLDDCDVVQLCAQALSLEEMLNVKIPRGSIFYGKTMHRFDVDFNQDLRDKTIDIAKRFHVLIKNGVTPLPIYNEKCESCSLIRQCMPKALVKSKSQQYLNKIFEI